MRTSALMLLLGSCDYEDGSREHGKSCFEEVDCGEDMYCDDWECLYSDGSRELGQSCIWDKECIEEAGQTIACVDEVCGYYVEDNDGGGGTIICNDGTRSPTCTSCDSGCCSGHGGCT
jgi:hypothetical protein